MSRLINALAAVAVDDIHPSPANPREHLTGIDELAASIYEVGLIQPLVVQRIPGKDGFQVVAGHRRLAAAKRIQMREVPCIIRRDLLPDEELLAMLVENGQRANLDPIEEAHAYRRLTDMGLTHADIARRVGRSTSTVAGRIALLRLPSEEQEEIRAGALRVTHVLDRARAERQQERLRAGGRGRGRPKGVKTKPYFGEAHPLAKTVRSSCDHRGRPKVAGIGCGECWEHAIRADERQAIR